jgi:GT2 family glycosyltransferase
MKNLFKKLFTKKNFDRNFYLLNNPDVKSAGIDPWEHYLIYGYKEGRPINEKQLVKRRQKNSSKTGEEIFSLADEIERNKRMTSAFPSIKLKSAKICVGIPVYSQYHLCADLLKSIALVQHEIRSLCAELLIINDSPHEGALLDHLQIPNEIKDIVSTIENPENIGFVKTCNKIFDVCIENNLDVILLNADTKIFPGTLQEIFNAAHFEPTIGFVSPRSNEASLCSWLVDKENTENWSAEIWYDFHKVISKSFPAIFYAPTACGFCLYIKKIILKDFGGFDVKYEKGYEEENDLILRANRVGYRSVIANHAFVWHKGSASFDSLKAKSNERKEINFKKICEKYPYYPQKIQEYFESADFKSQKIVVNTRHSKEIKFYFSTSHFENTYNGTFELGKNMLTAADKTWPENVKIYTYLSKDAQQLHKIYPTKRLYVLNSFEEIPFCDYSLHPSQVFAKKQLKEAFSKANRVSFFMQDTIASDCMHMNSTLLEKLWRFSLRWADIIFTNSEHTKNQYICKYPNITNIAAALLSCVPETDGMRQEQKTLDFNISNTDFILIYGNSHDHKFVEPTLRFLKSKLSLNFFVFGVNGFNTDRVTYVPSGAVPNEELACIKSQCKVAIFPSHAEGFGFPVRDLPAYGKTIFCRAIGCYREILQHLPACLSENVVFYNDNFDLLEKITHHLNSCKKNTSADLSFQKSTEKNWDDVASLVWNMFEKTKRNSFDQISERTFWLDTCFPQ